MGEDAVAELLYGMPLLRSMGDDGEASGCGALLAELKVCSCSFSARLFRFAFRGLWLHACICLWLERVLVVVRAWEQQLWGEIGKSREERERMVRELEAECMRVYRRKVDEATGERAMLHQSLAAGEAEIAALTAALGADNSPQLKVGAKIRRFLPFLASTVLLKNDATVVHSSSRNL
jgi:Ase1/PRC1/MAP65 family protein